jgi:hypothetical protein
MSLSAWSGNFDALLKHSGDLLEIEGLRRPTASLLRYYQRQGLLGKGSKQGREAVFSQEDLQRVLAAKKLIKAGWSLDAATGAVNSSTSLEVLRYADVMNGSPSSFSPPAPPPQRSHVDALNFSRSAAFPIGNAAALCASVAPAAHSAQNVVRTLMSSAGLHASSPSAPYSKTNIATGNNTCPPSASAEPPIKTSSIVNIDWVAAAKAPPAQRALLMKELLDALKKLNDIPQHDAPSPPRPRKKQYASE